jgi:hypothetical protein
MVNMLGFVMGPLQFLSDHISDKSSAKFDTVCITHTSIA